MKWVEPYDNSEIAKYFHNRHSFTASIDLMRLQPASKSQLDVFFIVNLLDSTLVIYYEVNLKETCSFYFCVNPKNQALHKKYQLKTYFTGWKWSLKF